MAVKFNEHWNIIPEHFDEYVEFMQQWRIPTMNNLGIKIVALWGALIGASPQIISEGVAEDLDKVEMGLKSDEFKKTNIKLLQLVTDYRSKILIPSGRFPHLPRVIEKGNVKFSQYWDIIPGKEKEYDDFIRTVHYPAMEEIGIRVAGEWYVLIGESPHIFYEARADMAEQLLNALRNPKFRVIKRDLLKLVRNYSSRVLVFHAFRAKGGTADDYEFFLV